MNASNKLYVGNLSYNTKDSDLNDFFSQAGDVVEAIVIKDRMTDRSRGFAFVTMGSEADLAKALELNGQELDGRQLRINKAERPSGGGGGGGFRGGNNGGGNNRGGANRGGANRGGGGSRWSDND
jgi:RNA recognition motif-containing protein